MDFTFTPEQDAFRQEVRDFVAREVTAKGRDRLVTAE
jgi:alkylation response protein AidB-like acyl-CoA dehydrogenase